MILLHRQWYTKESLNNPEFPIMQDIMDVVPKNNIWHSTRLLWLLEVAYHSITNSVVYSLGDQQYKFEEILPIYKVVSQEQDTGTFADFMEGFKTFDREGQGMMAYCELRNCLIMMGMSQPQTDLPEPVEVLWH